jgi:hypothetical protein
LQEEWLNSRGAIARFERQTIEIRVLDVQECPRADLAICEAITAVLRKLCREQWTSVAEQQSVPTASLRDVLLDTIRHAEQTVITDRRYLAQFGVERKPVSARELWASLLDPVLDGRQTICLSAAGSAALRVILDSGPLSRRIEAALAGDMERLPTIYGELSECLARGCMFRSDAG